MRLEEFKEHLRAIAGGSSEQIIAKPVGAWAVSQLRIPGRQFWVVAADRDDAGRFIVQADEKLTAFVELERAIHQFAVSLVA